MIAPNDIYFELNSKVIKLIKTSTKGKIKSRDYKCQNYRIKSYKTRKYSQNITNKLVNET